jgi:hypothetical protein
VSFLLSARGIVDAVKVGPVHKQAVDVVELLSDPARCQVILVTVPEETPVNELVDTAYAIEDRAGVALGPIVVNGCMPVLDGFKTDPGFARAAVAAMAAHGQPSLTEGLGVALADAEAFRAGLQRRQRDQCARLAQCLPLPQLRLPYLFTAELGPDELDVLAAELVRGIDALDAELRP